MNVQLWWNEEMKYWRWTITQTNRPILKQESGQATELSEVMNILALKLEAINK